MASDFEADMNALSAKLDAGEIPLEKLMEAENTLNGIMEGNQTPLTITMGELYKQEYPEELFIIDKFIPQTGIVMFSGSAGVGKSFVSLEIVRSITTGELFLEHFEVKSKELPILIIDKENGLRRLQSRARSIGIPPTDNVFTLSEPEVFSLTNEPMIKEIRQFVSEKKVGVIILDSFIDVLMGKENASEDTAKVFNALRAIASNVCWVILHHESKPPVMGHGAGAVQAIDKARGSTNIAGQVDYLFSIQRTKELRTILIEQAKARDYATMPKFRVEFINEDGEMKGFRYGGEVQDEVLKVDEAMGFIQDYLLSNPSSSRQSIIDTAEGEGFKLSTIESALRTLKDKNIVCSKEDPTNKSKRLYQLLSAEIGDETSLLE